MYFYKQNETPVGGLLDGPSRSKMQPGSTVQIKQLVLKEKQHGHNMVEFRRTCCMVLGL